VLITNIGELTTNVARDDDRTGTLHDAAVVVEGGRIAWVGAAGDAPRLPDTVDAGGRAVIPGFVDSHTHLVFAGDRADEFEARMAGTPYAAGGIRRTVAATRAASDDELRRGLARLVAECARQGTTTLEVKTGYGLTVHDEARAARIAAEVTPEVTFLGAHVVPAEYADARDEYVARMHGNQLGPGDGVRVAVEMDAASVDHCTYLSDDDVAALAGSRTVATLLPGVEFSTRQPYPDARRLIDAGVTVAIASDCNPGSCFTSSMPLMVALAVREMGMTPGEAIWAATAGGARALRREDVGAIAPGMRADLVILDAPTRVHLAYRPGVPLVSSVVKDGRPVPAAAVG